MLLVLSSLLYDAAGISVSTPVSVEVTATNEIAASASSSYHIETTSTGSLIVTTSVASSIPISTVVTSAAYMVPPAAGCAVTPYTANTSSAYIDTFVSNSVSSVIAVENASNADISVLANALPTINVIALSTNMLIVSVNSSTTLPTSIHTSGVSMMATAASTATIAALSGYSSASIICSVSKVMQLQTVVGSSSLHMYVWQPRRHLDITVGNHTTLGLLKTGKELPFTVSNKVQLQIAKSNKGLIWSKAQHTMLSLMLVSA